MPRTKGPHNIVVNPFPATARAQGRTEQVRINGAISKAAKDRLDAAPGGSMTEKLNYLLTDTALLKEAYEQGAQDTSFCGGEMFRGDDFDGWLEWKGIKCTT